MLPEARILGFRGPQLNLFDALGRISIIMYSYEIY